MEVWILIIYRKDSQLVCLESGVSGGIIMKFKQDKEKGPTK